jgi:hypothetical protein
VLPRQAKVTDLCLAARVDQDVRGLQVCAASQDMACLGYGHTSLPHPAPCRGYVCCMGIIAARIPDWLLAVQYRNMFALCVLTAVHDARQLGGGGGGSAAEHC